VSKKTKDSLGDRMKGNYENRSKTYLTRRTPVIIRLDGKAFHSFTRGFHRPYDQILHEAMEATLKYLCENIQGCKLGYQQSDEITLVLTDYDTLQTDAWFDYSVQKMCSIAASMATFAFNRNFEFLVDEYVDAVAALQDLDLESNYIKALMKARDRGAMFDARCFNVPREEVNNSLVWRQQDATRNAVQMLGQAHFSHKQLDRKSQSDIQEMLFTERGINFNDCSTDFKRGVCCVRQEIKVGDVVRHKWVIDQEIPIFSQHPEYVENLI
jgi:tRNA(His) 5'-end guanylyltransferase